MASITITGSNTTTGVLTLSDNGVTNASRGELITWVVLPSSGVDSITAIKNYETSINVFNPDPAPLGGGSKNWQGTVSPTIDVPSTETYYIDWKDTSGNSHQYDPQIKVNT